MLLEVTLEKPDTFNPPIDVLDSNFDRISRSIEVLYDSGVLRFLGTKYNAGMETC